jgi:hypothetical protein
MPADTERREPTVRDIAADIPPVSKFPRRVIETIARKCAQGYRAVQNYWVAARDAESETVKIQGERPLKRHARTRNEFQESSPKKISRAIVQKVDFLLPTNDVGLPLSVSTRLVSRSGPSKPEIQKQMKQMHSKKQGRAPKKPQQSNLTVVVEVESPTPQALRFSGVVVKKIPEFWSRLQKRVYDEEGVSSTSNRSEQSRRWLLVGDQIVKVGHCILLSLAAYQTYVEIRHALGPAQIHMSANIFVLLVGFCTASK